jgi:hypothetical protein
MEATGGVAGRLEFDRIEGLIPATGTAVPAREADESAGTGGSRNDRETWRGDSAIGSLTTQNDATVQGESL